MNSAKKQKLLLEYLISSPDVFALCSPILKPDYFNPEFRNAVVFIQDYYQAYNSLPSPEQIEVEADLELSQQIVTKDQLDYCCTEIEQFCKDGAMTHAILKSAEIIEQGGDHGKIDSLVRDALMVSLHKDLGVELFDDPEKQLSEISSNPPVPVGYTEFDVLLDGGLRRQEMLLLSANSGGGKSIVLANIGLQLALLHGLSVLYLSLELPVPMIFKRYAAMVSGINPREIDKHRSEVASVIQEVGQRCGKITIEKMPVGTKPMQIRAFLKEFELKNRYVPDVLLLDYIDLMDSNEKISADNVFQKDKSVSEDFREILVDYNMIGATASQQNREAVNAVQHHHGHIAGGISKVNTTDVYVSILMNEVLKAKGEIGFQFLKTRSSDGVGKTIYLEWDRVALRVKNPKHMKNRLSFPRTEVGEAEAEATNVERDNDDPLSGFNTLFSMSDNIEETKDDTSNR